MKKNRLLTCTFLALTSGFFGAYVGGQITSMVHSQKCQNQSWGLKVMCNVWVTPGAAWHGSITGLWTGAILGAFVGGSITHQKR
ncbi:hypothetical protein [Umezakia ovalisporum]|jgi:hypothetical protein|uniref:hypothetical protein n=1 Tax=Umezakia ovalisporum TaxID=75695 RepID=UPI0006F1C0B5|nr:hypothetical protein [Umezakia ovalisporum]MBI1240255.1 hypothetical protein [Nostoc sp. RI_552]MDH6085555.1 hypothetical protein [Umezakia ovalisporum TAC611]CEJ42264.1 Uncharacterized protein apha_00132 [Umezakia ovalisporum]